MLEELTLRNVGVIEEASLTLGPGLTALSGESGAGKTLVLTGLGLLMGQRADAGVVRGGAGQAVAEAVWRVGTDWPHLQRVEDAGGEVEEGELLVSRSVKTDGKSRAVLGGRAVPARTLGDLTSRLVNIHGQADQQRLRDAAAQRQALDRFVGSALAAPMGRYQHAWREVKRVQRDLADLRDNAAARHREYLLLSTFMEEFNALDPQVNEVEELEKEIERLSHLDKLREGLASAHQMLDPQSDEMMAPADALSIVRRSLTRLAHYDPELERVNEALGQAAEALDSAMDELHHYADRLDADGLERLYEAQERLTSVKAFLKRHRLTLEEAFAQAEDAQARMEDLDPETHSEEALQKVLEAATKTMTAEAKKVSDLRLKAARKLEKKVNEELAGLAMAGVRLEVALTACEPAIHGVEDVALMVSQPGSREPRSITRAASGGELSRIMLALEVVLADPAETPTYVFDEVDAGIGGATAIEVGKRLARLAQEGAQVIVVTHLPQVAVWASTHLKVKKTTVKGRATTTVEALDGEERVREIARLLSGLEDSTSGHAHAEELLAMAEAFRVEQAD